VQGVLRLYLAACVVNGHMWQVTGLAWFHAPLDELWSNAGFAVIGFFIISGFVCAMQIDERFLDGRWVAAGRYYRDRLIRIYPTYLLVVALCLPVYVLLSEVGRRMVWTETSVATFIALNLMPPVMNVWQMVRGGGFSYLVTPVAWSLGNEIVFYVLAPVLFVIFRGRWALWGVGLLAVAEPFMRMRSPAINYVDPAFNLKYFVLGMLAYFLARRLPRYQFEGWLLPTMLMLAYLAVARPLSVYFHHHGPEAIGFYACTAAAIIASAALVRTSKLDLVLGHISYPLFLIHVPIMQMSKTLQIGNGTSRFVFVWVASLVASVAIYFLFDRAVNQMRVREQGYGMRIKRAWITGQPSWRR
jgi:peptidoglycan/LPS O-acetylase OafA/YrhL